MITAHLFSTVTLSIGVIMPSTAWLQMVGFLVPNDTRYALSCSSVIFFIYSYNLYDSGYDATAPIKEIKFV